MKNTQTSKAIKRIRTMLGVTQEVFAVQINVSAATVKQWEIGRCCPSPRNYDAIRQLLSMYGYRISHTYNMLGFAIDVDKGREEG